MRLGAGHRKKVAKLNNGWRQNVNQEITHCYCQALDLTYPHYLAEHDPDHDAARELRARLAEGNTE